MSSKRQVHTGGTSPLSLADAGKGDGWWVRLSDPMGIRVLLAPKIDLKRDVIFDALAWLEAEEPEQLLQSRRSQCLSRILKNVRHNPDCCHRF